MSSNMPNTLTKEDFDRIVNELYKAGGVPDSGKVLVMPDSMKMGMDFAGPAEDISPSFAGMTVITSKYLPKNTVEVVRGIPSKHKPNTRRPLYRKTRVPGPPVMYLIDQRYIENRVREVFQTMQREMEGQAFNMVRSVVRYDPWVGGL